MPYNVAVIGCGVSGLTSAIELLRANHSVTIFARELPQDTTSAVPAALWFPYHVEPEEDVNRWALATLRRLQQLQDEPTSGVRFVDFWRISKVAPPRVEKWASPDDLRWLKRIELPRGYNFGYSVSVPLMQNPTYLNYLNTTFRKLGGRFVERALTSLDGIDKSYEVIVNCSGYGAKALCCDAELKPSRGVVVLVAKTMPECHIVADENNESLMYVLTRERDCVMGGCDQLSDDETFTQEEVSAILARCSVVNGCDRVTVDTTKVGIRPVRPTGVCLRPVVFADRLVVHNYGHGGAGFTLSWGCAEDVVRFVA